MHRGADSGLKRHTWAGGGIPRGEIPRALRVPPRVLEGVCEEIGTPLRRPGS